MIDILLIAGGIVSLIFEPLSIAIHSVIGLVFVGTVGPHLWNRRRWIAGTLTRLRRPGRLPAARRWGLAQSSLLDARSRIRWHAISSVVLVAVVARHAWTRRQWLLRRRRRS